MFTLEELQEIQAALEVAKHIDSYLDEADEALRLVARAIAMLASDKI